jgi:hypothetical protein
LPSEDAAAGDGTISLSDLAGAVAVSLLRSVEPLRRQHIDATAEFFEPAGAEAGPALRPRTLALHVPRPVAEKGSEDAPSAIPLAALLQHSPIVLEEASLEMQCRVTGFDRAGNAPADLRLALDMAGAGAPMRLALKYRLAAPPEGLARIDDSLVRGL